MSMTTPTSTTPTSAAPAPDPDLGSVVPARYSLVSRVRVTLTANLPNDAELVISRGPMTGPGVQLPGQDSTEDVQLLTWDPELRRWNLTFDAHTMTVNQQRASSDYSSQDLEQVLVADHPVTDITARTVTVAPGHTVLMVFGTDNQTMDVALQRTAVISVTDGIAHQEFYTALEDGRPPQVAGPADHQQVHLSGRYTSLVDPVSNPVRDFTQTIGWTPGSPTDGRGPIGVLDDDRPGIGLTLARPAGTNETTAVTVVASVRPGSPAARAGVHPGEQLEAITPAVPRAAGQPASDPAVIDQLAAHHTGDRVTLRLRHGDDVRTLTLTTVKIQDVQAGPGAPIPQGAHLGVTTDPYGQVLGAAITSIAPDSPAAHARLAVGDTITQLGAMPVQTTTRCRPRCSTPQASGHPSRSPPPTAPPTLSTSPRPRPTPQTGRWTPTRCDHASSAVGTPQTGPAPPLTSSGSTALQQHLGPNSTLRRYSAPATTRRQPNIGAVPPDRGYRTRLPLHGPSHAPPLAHHHRRASPVTGRPRSGHRTNGRSGRRLGAGAGSA